MVIYGGRIKTDSTKDTAEKKIRKLEEEVADLSGKEKEKE